MDGGPGQDPAYRATYAKAPLKRGAFASLRVYDQRRTAESRVEVNVYSAAEEDGMAQRRVVIMGAAGRDFHDFNMLYRGKEAESRVVAFTATQIPRIDSRLYPTELAGAAYPEGIPIYPEEKLEEIISNEGVDEVIFEYSDVSHEHVMHQASRALAAGANFRLHGPRFTSIPAAVPVISVCAVRTGAGKSQTSRYIRMSCWRRECVLWLFGTLCRMGTSFGKGCNGFRRWRIWRRHRLLYLSLIHISEP